MRAVTALLLGLAVSGPAAAIEPLAASEALQRNQGWVQQRISRAECERLHRSFLERNRLSPSRRRARLNACLERARETMRSEGEPSHEVAVLPAMP